MTWRIALTVATALLAAPDGLALAITHVRHAPAVIGGSPRSAVQVRFRISEAAEVWLRLFDARDLLVREIAPEDAFPAGDQHLRWDGRDAEGRPVPPESYHYVLEARDEAGRVVVYDLTDLSGGEPVAIAKLSWDREAGLLHYQVPRPARVRLRAALQDGGPLLRTLLDWVPRGRGSHAEPWDGRDASGVLDVGADPRLRLTASAFALGRNEILVLPHRSRPEWIEDLPWGRLPRETTRRRLHQPWDSSTELAERRGDYRIRLELPDDLARGADGVPLVRGPFAVRLDAPPQEAERLQAERFGVEFHVDGRFVFMNEDAYLPLTWVWDPKGEAAGPHFITANVLGYQGNRGAATVQFCLRPVPSDDDVAQ